jgi:predicted nucleic acid-binding protein
MIVVSDTSALSNLAIVDHLWLLEAIYQTVIIPDVVASELAAASNPNISAILQLGWLQTQSLANTQLADQLQQERGLEAVRLGLSIIGILGILLVAKQKSLISQVQPVMDALINQAGFRVSPQLYQRVLALSQEP